MTREQFDRLSPIQQASLWPRCKTCGHIAQHHKNHINEPEKNSCDDITEGGSWLDRVPCNCMGYNGPDSTNVLLLLIP